MKGAGSSLVVWKPNRGRQMGSFLVAIREPKREL